MRLCWVFMTYHQYRNINIPQKKYKKNIKSVPVYYEYCKINLSLGNDAHIRSLPWRFDFNHWCTSIKCSAIWFQRSSRVIRQFEFFRQLTNLERNPLKFWYWIVFSTCAFNKYLAMQCQFIGWLFNFQIKWIHFELLILNYSEIPYPRRAQ